MNILGDAEDMILNYKCPKLKSELA